MWSGYQEMYFNTKNVIKKWCRRYALYGIKGLKDLSRRLSIFLNK